ncbi:MAG TPA: hypothetical protein P5280_06420 [Cyclobacteriaceae bacterium]|nr:hypothetical protein [Cyclobacteriaceae bacterium]
MKSIKEIQLQDAWKKKDPAIRESAKSFWLAHKVILREEVLTERSKQLLVVARDSNGKIIATSTALKTHVKLLNNNWLYQYRCFVDPMYRTIGLDIHLTVESLRLLEAYASDELEKPIGVYVVVENENLMNNKINNAAVWRAYKMYFVGFNSKGQQVRVLYFNGAMI